MEPLPWVHGSIVDDSILGPEEQLFFTGINKSDGCEVGKKRTASEAGLDERATDEVKRRMIESSRFLADSGDNACYAVRTIRQRLGDYATMHKLDENSFWDDPGVESILVKEFCFVGHMLELHKDFASEPIMFHELKRRPFLLFLKIMRPFLMRNDNLADCSWIADTSQRDKIDATQAKVIAHQLYGGYPITDDEYKKELTTALEAVRLRRWEAVKKQMKLLKEKLKEDKDIFDNLIKEDEYNDVEYIDFPGFDELYKKHGDPLTSLCKQADSFTQTTYSDEFFSSIRPEYTEEEEEDPYRQFEDWYRPKPKWWEKVNYTKAISRTLIRFCKHLMEMTNMLYSYRDVLWGNRHRQGIILSVISLVCDFPVLADTMLHMPCFTFCVKDLHAITACSIAKVIRPATFQALICNGIIPEGIMNSPSVSEMEKKHRNAVDVCEEILRYACRDYKTTRAMIDAMFRVSRVDPKRIFNRRNGEASVMCVNPQCDSLKESDHTQCAMEAPLFYHKLLLARMRNSANPGELIGTWYGSRTVPTTNALVWNQALYGTMKAPLFTSKTRNTIGAPSATKVDLNSLHFLVYSQQIYSFRTMSVESAYNSTDEEETELTTFSSSLNFPPNDKESDIYQKYHELLYKMTQK